jgi:uncharacterized protein DUF4291
MNLITESYQAQVARWPGAGRHILAQFDSDSIVVYQAYRPSIGRFAAEHGYFGGEFSLGRMSWIKTNFLWMMYRCGWGTKPDQEVVLAVRLRRAAFNEILAQAVPSRFEAELFATPAEFRAALATSSVRLQWDPDHDPSGAPVERRAVQLGLRGEVLSRYAREWILDIQDISPFVAEQRAHLKQPGWPQLVSPREEVHAVTDAAAARRLGLSEEK